MCCSHSPESTLQVVDSKCGAGWHPAADWQSAWSCEGELSAARDCPARGADHRSCEHVPVYDKRSTRTGTQHARPRVPPRIRATQSTHTEPRVVVQFETHHLPSRDRQGVGLLAVLYELQKYPQVPLCRTASRSMSYDEKPKPSPASKTALQSSAARSAHASTEPSAHNHG